MTLTEPELTGRVRTHVSQHDALRCALHPRALAAFLDLRAAAAGAGFDLLPISSFRDAAAQIRIWNMKFRGERPLYDEAGGVRDRAALTAAEAVEAILGWSALPGASRHHWGTDVDVYDGLRVASKADVLLLPGESAVGGPFHELHRWLDAEMGRYGFFRPYDAYRGGMQPEPWHLSFAEVSVPALAAMTVEVLARALAELEIDAKELVVPRLTEIHRQYVVNVGQPERRSLV